MLLNWDVALFYRINQGHQNALFDRVMPYLTEFDHWRFWLLGAWLVWFVLGGKKTRITLALLILLVGLLDYSNSFFFKHLFARVRPCNALPEVRVFWPCPRSFSFPSNHAANVFGGVFFYPWFTAVGPPVWSLSRYWWGIPGFTWGSIIRWMWPPGLFWAPAGPEECTSCGNKS